MFEQFDFGAITGSLHYFFMDGMVFTVKLTFLAGLCGFLFGTSLTFLRFANIPFLSRAVIIYVNFIRSLPLVLFIFWFAFLLPGLWQWAIHSPYPVALNPFMLAFCTFTLFEAAYFAEIMRAGIQSVSQGQLSASLALGLTNFQAALFVILPQAFRNVLPILLTQMIALFQDTTLVYIISLTDFFGAVSKVALRDGRQVELYLFAAFVYFLVSFLSSCAVRKLQKPQKELWV